MKNHYPNRHWISKIIEGGQRIRIKNPLIASILFFGLPFDIILSIFLILRISLISPKFVISYILVALWLNLGPFFIWYYDQRLLPEFFRKTTELLSDSRELKKTAEKYDKLFSRGYWILIIPWLVLVILISNPMDFILNVAGIFGFNDPFFWLFFIAILWVSFLASVGSWGVAVTIMAIKEISEKNLNIDPLHPDKRGGLSCIGYYAIGTTILFSTGSLMLPLAFQLVAEKESVKNYMYLAVLLYSLIILLSFIYPIIWVNIKAELSRDATLNLLRNKQKEINKKLIKPNLIHTEKIEGYLELYKIRTEYDDFRKVKLYPFEFDTIAKLVSSVLLPILFILIQYFWFS